MAIGWTVSEVVQGGTLMSITIPIGGLRLETETPSENYDPAASDAGKYLRVTASYTDTQWRRQDGA